MTASPRDRARLGKKLGKNLKWAGLPPAQPQSTRQVDHSPSPPEARRAKKQTDADRNWAIEQALKGEPHYRDPRKERGIPDNILLFLPPLPKLGKGTLAPAEVKNRIKSVRESIDKAKKFMPFAAAQLQHWIDAKGKHRVIRKSDLNVFDPERAILTSIRDAQYEKLKNGIIERLQVGHDQFIKRGQTKRIYRQTQIRWEFPSYKAVIDPTRADVKKADTYFGVGTTQVVSELTVHRATEESCADILKWRFQLYDNYNWEEKKKATLPIPRVWLPKIPIPKDAYSIEIDNEISPFAVLSVKDDWFRELERSSDAHSFEAFSVIFVSQLKKAQRICVP